MSRMLIIAVIQRGAVAQVGTGHKRSRAHTPRIPWRKNEPQSAWSSKVGSAKGLVATHASRA